MIPLLEAPLFQNVLTTTLVGVASLYLACIAWRYAAALRATAAAPRGRCGGCTGCGTTRRT